MTKQTINFGTPPLGIGGDTYKSAFEKCNDNFTELYNLTDYKDGAGGLIRVYRDLASYHNKVNSLKGAIVIHLPKAKNKSTTMMLLTLRGYNYVSGTGAWELKVGGYNYTSGWMQYSANLDGPAPFSTVQMGMASDHQVIILGTTTTTWSYPIIHLSELIAGYSNISGWDSGFTITVETELSAYTGLVTPTLYGINRVKAAEKLLTARTIGGVSFDGSANINLPGVNTQGNQNTTGNAATATKLQTARTINGVSFDGTANITVADSTKLPLTGGSLTGALNGTTAVFSGSVQVGNGIHSTNAVSFLNAGAAQSISTGGVLVSNSYADATKVPTNGIYSKGKIHTVTSVEIGSSGDGAKDRDYVRASIHSPTHTGGDWEHAVRDDATYAYYKIKYGTSGHLQLRSDGTLSASGGFDGNAASATKLATARTINGTSFNGSANITTANWGTARTLTVGRTGKSVNGSANVTWTADEVLPTGTNGQVLKHNGTSWVAGTDNNTTYSAMSAAEATTGTATTGRVITAAVLKGAIQTHAPAQTSVTGNAGTATKLATERTFSISGGATAAAVSFNGTGNVQLNVTSLDASKLTGTASVNTTGNAATAGKLQAPVKINGIDFDGSQSIELPLTGAKKLSIACNLEYPTYQPKAGTYTYYRTTDVWNEVEFQTTVTSDVNMLLSYIGTVKLLIFSNYLPRTKGNSYTGRVLFVSHQMTTGSSYGFTLRLLDLDPAYSDTQSISRGSTAQPFRILPDITNIPEFSSIVANNTTAGDYTFTFTKPFIGEYVAIACVTNGTAGTDAISLTRNAGSIRVASYVNGTASDTLKISLILSGEQQA